jgi:hypothetical protein
VAEELTVAEDDTGEVSLEYEYPTELEGEPLYEPGVYRSQAGQQSLLDGIIFRWLQASRLAAVGDKVLENATVRHFLTCE